MNFGTGHCMATCIQRITAEFDFIKNVDCSGLFTDPEIKKKGIHKTQMDAGIAMFFASMTLQIIGRICNSGFGNRG